MTVNISKLKPFDKIEIVRKVQRLSITQKLILIIIATHVGKNEWCFVSLSTLQEECCITKRTALISNIKSLINANILWKIPPSKGFKSNRYAINFNLLVTDGHQSSDLQLLDQSPTVTRLVTVGHPKRNINKVKEIKETLVTPKAKEQKSKETGKKAVKDIIKKLNVALHH